MPASDRRALIVVAALSALSIAPLALADYAPMQDLAAHVETSCQLVHLWRDDARFTSVLDVQTQPWANSLPMIVLAALLAVWPAYGAAKFLVAICAICWPLSLAFCFRAFGRSPWLALIALPTIFDLSWSYGFLQFIAAKPLLPLALTIALAHAKGGGWKAGIGLSVLLVVVFLTHSLVWLLAMSGVGVVIIVCASGGRERVLRLWPLVPVALATAPFFLATRGAHGQTRFHDVVTAVKDAWGNLGDLHAGASDGVAWIVAGGCALMMLQRPARPTREHAALLMVGMMVLGGYAFGPTVLPQVSVVAPRLAGTALGLLTGALPSPTGKKLSALIVAMSLAFAWHIADVTRSYRAFSRVEMGEFQELLRDVPDGARLATFYTSTSSPFARHNALWHWPKLYCLAGDGFTDDLFAYRKTAYVFVKDKSFVTMPHRMKPEALAQFGALLARGNARVPPNFEQVGSTGSWKLYVRRP